MTLTSNTQNPKESGEQRLSSYKMLDAHCNHGRFLSVSLQEAELYPDTLDKSISKMPKIKNIY